MFNTIELKKHYDTKDPNITLCLVLNLMFGGFLAATDQHFKHRNTTKQEKMEMNTPQSGMNKDLFFSYEQVDSFYFTIYDNLAFFNYFFQHISGMTWGKGSFLLLNVK